MEECACEALSTRALGMVRKLRRGRDASTPDASVRLIGFVVAMLGISHETAAVGDVSSCMYSEKSTLPPHVHAPLRRVPGALED